MFKGEDVMEYLSLRLVELIFSVIDGIWVELLMIAHEKGEVCSFTEGGGLN